MLLFVGFLLWFWAFKGILTPPLFLQWSIVSNPGEWTVVYMCV